MAARSAWVIPATWDWIGSQARGRERQAVPERIPTVPHLHDSVGFVHNDIGQRPLGLGQFAALGHEFEGDLERNVESDIEMQPDEVGRLRTSSRKQRESVHAPTATRRERAALRPMARDPDGRFPPPGIRPLTVPGDRTPGPDSRQFRLASVDLGIDTTCPQYRRAEQIQPRR